MKAIRKAHAVDFWVWKKEWSKRQAAVELDKFSHEIDARLEILVPFGDPRYLYIKHHCYVFPDEVVVYDDGHIYRYNRDDTSGKAFVKRYSFEEQETPSKYAIRLKDTEIYLYYGKEENTYKFDLLQSSENNLVWFITEQEAQNFINKVFFNPKYNIVEAVQIEGDE